MSDKTNKVEWIFKPSRAGDIRNSIADVLPIASLGWKPSVALKEGLKKTCKNFEKSRENFETLRKFSKMFKNMFF